MANIDRQRLPPVEMLPVGRANFEAISADLAGKASTLRRDDDGGESCRFRRTRRRAGASGGHGQAGVSYAVGLITPPTNGDLTNALVGSTALDSIE